MARTKKTGKERLDKYYKLAKEQGFGLLENARCCIDLCAAPGGWLQVASKHMPVNSVIVGVDLVPIKPIPRVATFAADITTDRCRTLVRNELKDWQADLVLHDGAPNVGTAWVHDAYAQSELVLASLKLATVFLAPNGTFVTKVFRSADYNALLWVFSQLFGKVEATKPPSSRNVSAEIFVVCREYKAPKFIDPKFLDPRHVFKELDVSTAGPSGIPVDKSSNRNNVQASVFQPEKSRRKRDGYDDGDYTLYHSVPVAEFIRASDPISLLGHANALTFKTEEEKEWEKPYITTPDVRACCDDLKVLGKGDFKSLLKWRTALREEVGLDVKTKLVEEGTTATEVVEITEDVDNAQIEEELARLNAEASSRAKRERRRANAVKTRTIQRMQLQMTAPLDIGLEQSDAALASGFDDDMNMRDANENADSSPDEAETQDNKVQEGETLERELDGMYDAYRARVAERDAKFRVREARKGQGDTEWHGFDAENDGDGNEDAASSDGGYEHVARAKAQIGEDDGFDSDDSDPTSEEPVVPKAKRKSENPVLGVNKKRKIDASQAPEPSRATQLWFAQDVFKNVGEEEFSDGDDEDMVDDDETSSKEDVETSPDDSPDDFEIVPAEPIWDVENDNEDAAKAEYLRKHALTTPEAVTLAQQLVSRQKTRAALIDDGFHRYSLQSKDDLPSWFLDDEAKHYKRNIPVTKDAIISLRAKQRALDARPIKKVAEAKARKKMRAAQRLQKALSKAEGVSASTDVSEAEKARQIEKLMRSGASAGKKKAKEEVKVVVAKGVHRGLQGRPKGVKGRYRMVDPRMRKEVRAQKRIEKANKKRKRS